MALARRSWASWALRRNSAELTFNLARVASDGAGTVLVRLLQSAALSAGEERQAGDQAIQVQITLPWTGRKMPIWLHERSNSSPRASRKSYYVGLLAGENDLAAVECSGERRAINRRNFTLAEVDQAMQRPVVQRLMRLIEFRNSYPAFNGHFEVIDAGDRQLWLGWQKEIHQCVLKVELDGPQTVIEYLAEDGQVRLYQP